VVNEALIIIIICRNILYNIFKFGVDQGYIDFTMMCIFYFCVFRIFLELKILLFSILKVISSR